MIHTCKMSFYREEFSALGEEFVARSKAQVASWTDGFYRAGAMSIRISVETRRFHRDDLCKLLVT